MNHKRQRGYVLILTVLMFMGIGGVVMASFTQEARRDLETRKYEHNQRVLAEAKQALLMFAYNYPQTNPGEGPGRLPCPDVDNDGTVDGPGTCAQVGRFPYADARLDVPRLLDASGETLWYAVSDAFDNIAGGGVINSDTAGTITLVDSTGQILYDGAVEGIAAVVIAPGTRLRRDNNSDGVYETEQVRITTGPGGDQRNPQNYLDTFTPFVGVTYDNSVFLNGSSVNDSDGLLQGPVFDTAQSDIVINDQMIIITAEEVIAMAEKAVLETYRAAIEDYRQTLWAAAGDRRYPWLAAYGNTTDLDIYDARAGETTGRVPFIDYFVDDNSPHEIIVGDLEISFDLQVAYNSMVDNFDPFNPAYIAQASDVVTGYPGGDQTVNISNALVSFSRTTFNGAADTSADNIGTLIVRDSGTSAITATTWGGNTERRYFWDGCDDANAGCNETEIPIDGWQLCNNGGRLPGDCAKSNVSPYGFEAFTGDWSNHANIAIRMIEFQYIDPDFVIELDYSPAPGITAPTQPTAAVHSRRTYTFDENEVMVLPIVDPAEPDTRNFFDIKVSMCDQDNYVGNNLNLYSLGNEDGQTVSCAVDLDLNITPSYQDDLVIEVDWFPQLPRWVADNNWDDAIMMAYMPDFGPGGDGGCTPDADPATPAADDCLVLTNLGGVNNDIEAVLVLAGEHDLVDGNDFNADGDELDPNEPDNDNFADELHDIFETENYSGIGLYAGPSQYPAPNNDPTPASDTGEARVFDKREELIPGNVADTVFVIN